MRCTNTRLLLLLLLLLLHVLLLLPNVKTQSLWASVSISYWFTTILYCGNLSDYCGCIVADFCNILDRRHERPLVIIAALDWQSACRDATWVVFCRPRWSTTTRTENSTTGARRRYSQLLPDCQRSLGYLYYNRYALFTSFKEGRRVKPVRVAGDHLQL